MMTEKDVENYFNMMERKKQKEIKLQRERQRQYDVMLKSDPAPVVIRVDQTIMGQMDFQNDTQKTSRHVSIQFLPHLYARDELEELTNFWRGKMIRVIFVSNKTFKKVINNREGFSIVYDEDGWNGIAKKLLDSDDKNELLQAAMNVIDNADSFRKEID